MEKAVLDGVELEYEESGSGEPVLMISPGPFADSFRPFLYEPSLVEQYHLIAYHQRGQVGSTRTPAPVSFEEHAADAAALLNYLGIRRAHAVGHATGANIALNLVVSRPDLVHTLALLEPALMNVPGAAAFFESVSPALAAYGSGDREKAMKEFLIVATGLDWQTCQTVVEKYIPGGMAQAMKDADTFFESYLPAINMWKFGPGEAAAISQPVLSVVGTKTERLFIEGRSVLHSWFPQVEDLTVEGVGHLQHMQNPELFSRGVTAFINRHSMTTVEQSASHVSA